MISILFHLFFNPWTLVAIVLIAALAALLYLTLGPARLVKIALDLRTWAVIAGVLAILGFAHQEKRYNDMTAKLDTVEQQLTATDDAKATTEFRMAQQGKRAAENSRIQAAIAGAKPSEVEDAVLDAIALERGDPIVAAQPAQSSKTKNKPKVKNGLESQAPAERAADRPAGDVDERLRKRSDVVVVP